MVFSYKHSTLFLQISHAH